MIRDEPKIAKSKHLFKLFKERNTRPAGLWEVWKLVRADAFNYRAAAGAPGRGRAALSGEKGFFSSLAGSSTNSEDLET